MNESVHFPLSIKGTLKELHMTLMHILHTLLTYNTDTYNMKHILTCIPLTEREQTTQYKAHIHR